MEIYTDDEVIDQIMKSRPAYTKSFFPDHEFEDGYPPEEIFIKYFNSAKKKKYGFKLQDNPRITMFIKGFEAETTKRLPSLKLR